MESIQAQEEIQGSSRCQSQTPAQEDWSRHSHDLPPNTPLRCHCGEPLSPDANTMPKLASAVSILSYAQSSCSDGGMARASLNDEDMWEDDFQAPYMPVHHVVQRDRGGHVELATERMEASEGNPGWQPHYQVDVGEEEAEMLESINPHWRATH